MAEVATPTLSKLSINETNGKSNGASTDNGTSSELKEQFKAFSKFGDTKSDGKLITLSQSDKWMKQANVIDEEITTVDTAIHFKKLKSFKLDFTDYKRFLDDLAKTKEIKLSKIKKKLCQCGPPTLPLIEYDGKAAAAVKRCTDTSKYTGSHKWRFDENGKGRGIAGRRDPNISARYSENEQKNRFQEEINEENTSQEDNMENDSHDEIVDH